MKRIISIILIFTSILSIGCISFAENDRKSEAENGGFYSEVNVDIPEVGGAYLCEAKTGKVIFAKDEFNAASPASVTKVMTLLLVMEALEAGKFQLSDSVRVSARAASMGGSQVFLEEGEKITVEDLIKATVIASGNDASVALAELTAGSESAFVKMMNQKALELGLKNTSFENCTGLDDTTTNHYSCSADIATISRELIKHELILKYSSIWQDSIRGGEFILTNTNRLVRYYDGCNGLKTGSTDKAGFCVTTTAKRGNMQLIAVIMGAKTKEDRNEAARALLDFGFANYTLFEKNEEYLENAKIIGGVIDSIPLYSKHFSCLTDKSTVGKIELVYDIPEHLTAPIKEGDIVGNIIFMLGEEQIGRCDIIAGGSVEKITFGEIFIRILKRIACG